MSAPLADEDLLLGGRVSLAQQAAGYRAAVDPVLLAAFTAAVAGDRVLDAGTGTGAAALCLAARVGGVRVTGIELRPEIAELARGNAARNGVDGRVTVVEGDVLRPPDALTPGGFDRVMMNPPYLKAGAASVPPDAAKAAANVEGEARLADWIGFAHAMLAPRGVLTVVHRADRVDEILARLHGRFGGVVLFPLWPRAGAAARRILVAATRDGRGPAALAAGLVLHEADGRFTAAAEAVLRDAAPLVP